MANDGSGVGDYIKTQGAKALKAYQQLELFMEEGASNGVIITELRVQGPMVTGSGYRVIVKATAGTRKFIAFHAAESLGELHAGLVSRVANDSLAYRDDIPYEERKAQGKAGSNGG